MGEGQEFFVIDGYFQTKSYASILTVQPGSNLDYFVGEAAPAYAASQAVRQFTRHMLFVKPNVLVVFDDIQLSQSLPMELRFHTETAPAASGAGVYLSQGANGVLRTEVLTPETATAAVGADQVTDSGANTFTMNSIRLQRTGSAWRNVTAFSWAAKTPQQVSIQPSPAGYTVAVGGRRISFQWDRTPAVETTPIPVVQSALPAFGGNLANGLASNTYIEIYGDNLANTTTSWGGGDFNGNNAPQSLAGTQVRVNGVNAFVYFVSPKQVNVNLPQDTALGPVELQVVNNGVPSNVLTVNRAAVSPAMLTSPAFRINGKQYVVALLPASTQGGPFVGQANLIAGVPFQPVRPGDRIVLYILGAGSDFPSLAGRGCRNGGE